MPVCHHAYNGQHCLAVLQACSESVNNESGIFISNRVVDQIETEQQIFHLISGLDLIIQPSEECRSAVIPFLCLYTFGVCGANNDDYRPTAAQCMEIRESVCESEWKKASDLLALAGLPPLPDCSSLDDEGLDCEQGKYNERL